MGRLLSSHAFSTRRGLPALGLQLSLFVAAGIPPASRRVSGTTHTDERSIRHSDEVSAAGSFILLTLQGIAQRHAADAITPANE